MLKRIRFFRLFRVVPLLFAVFADLPAFVRMCGSLVAGRYRNISGKTVFKIFFALCYLVFFIDLIPDFIPFIGWVDDIAILTLLINSLKGEIELFRRWERKK